MATQIAMVIASNGENDETASETIEALTNARLAELEASFKIVVPPITITTSANGEIIACITYKDANG